MEYKCSKATCCTIQYGEDAGICMLDNCRCHSPEKETSTKKKELTSIPGHDPNYPPKDIPDSSWEEWMRILLLKLSGGRYGVREVDEMMQDIRGIIALERKKEKRDVISYIRKNILTIDKQPEGAPTFEATVEDLDNLLEAALTEDV